LHNVGTGVIAHEISCPNEAVKWWAVNLRRGMELFLVTVKKALFSRASEEHRGNNLKLFREYMMKLNIWFCSSFFFPPPLFFFSLSIHIFPQRRKVFLSWICTKESWDVPDWTPRQLLSDAIEWVGNENFKWIKTEFTHWFLDLHLLFCYRPCTVIDKLFTIARG